MYRYKGQLKDAKLNTKRAMVRGIPCLKCLDIFTFDIEVTSAWLSNGRLISYEPGKSADFWNDKEKYALPYIWQFSYNDQVYYGSELQSFKDLLGDIPKNVYAKIYIHNASYEFQFLLNIMTVKEVFARAPHKPMKFTFEEFPNIEFYCSYILTNMSLEQWGDQLGIPKLVGELDYNMMRTPYFYDPETDEIHGTPLFDFELEYCERDCIVVYHGIKKHLEQYKDVWDIPLTSTGKIRRVIKRRVTKDKSYMKEVKRTIPKDATEYHRLQTVFAGGYTHGNRKYIDKVVKGPVHHIDIASSYPTVLCAYKFPYGRWSYIGKRKPNFDTIDYRAYIVKVRFTNLHAISWNTYISVSKSRGRGFVYDNGRVLAADTLETTVTEMDLLTIYNNYEWDDIEFLGTWCCQKRYLPKIFIEYVLKLYHDKTSLKGVDPVRYAISKQYINSLFGMCVTALFQSDVEFLDGVWGVSNVDPEVVNAGLEKMRMWFNTKYFLSYAVGCWVTAYARRRLWSCIEEIDKDLIYTDTDSLFYIGDHNFTWFNDDITDKLREACKYQGLDFELTRPADPSGELHPMGVLDQEPDAIRFKTLGAKKYVEERSVLNKKTGKQERRLFLTVAGVNKGAVGCLKNINEFSDGFIFDKDSEYVHKLEHTYLEDMKPVTWPGGYYSEFKFGINMRPTGYKLSKPDVYQDAINIMETGVINFSEYFLAKRRGIFKL